MAVIPEEKVREVRAKSGILEVISEYLPLKKSGGNFVGLCPFHSEKTGSFSVNPAKEIYHCFGCGVGGDVFGFIMKIEGLTFPEAVRFLAARVGVHIEDRPLTFEEKQRSDERETLFMIIEQAVHFFTKILAEAKEGEPGRRYLSDRSVDAGAAAACRLGYAPEKWDALTRHLEQKRISLTSAEKVGLVKRREGGGFYDTFRNRLLFPISDPYGRCIGFGGRVLDDSVPKYLNSPESVVYHKSEVLYGLSLAKKQIREKSSVFIVEGYFDHLALYQAGIENVVATCGTALTSGHVKLLKRSAEKAFILFDADPAGKKASLRAMELFLEHDFPANVVTLPSGEDPDSFMRKFGRAAFEENVGCSLPAFEYFYRDLCRNSDIGSVEGKMRVIDEIMPRLAKVPSSIERHLHIREISRVLGVEENLLLRKAGLQTRGPVSTPPLRNESRNKGAVGPEEMLLCLMAKYPEVSERVKEFGIQGLFREDFISLAEAIIAGASAGKPLDWPLILNVVSEEERRRLSALFVDDRHLDEIDVDKAFNQCLIALERAALKDMKALTRELAAAEPGSHRYSELLGEIDSLRSKKSQLS